MRNLKKFLALVMAMVMAFSLMLNASAAEVKPSAGFSDNDGITEAFVEAVDVLAGMKVYKGDDTGTLRPGSTITRAEVAALIYRLATGDVEDTRAGLYANYGNFKDVNESDWFAGYVGYCANAGYIKGHNGYFSPYGNVTGYEALAMVLRAIGYDKNHEFEGATWQTNVSALGTQLGILDDIKTTDYANTLHLASRRDVVASILFRAAAYVPMVNYTALSGYDKWTNLTSNILNDTLGFKLFGLTNADGIIVGNQETGKSDTKFRFERDTLTDTKDRDGIISEPVDIAYTGETTVGLKMDTGLMEFGHKFNVWFDDSGRNSGSNKTVYAAYDKVAKTELAFVDAEADGSLDALTDANFGGSTMARTNAYELGAVAARYGFSVGDKAWWSDSFSTIYKDQMTNAGAFYNTQGLYLLISNSGSKNLDLVVSVNAQGTDIVRTDNVSATKSVSVHTNAAADFIDLTDNKCADLTLSATVSSNTMLYPSAVNTFGVIKQSALTANSSTKLGDYVIATGIGMEQNYNDATKYTEITNYQLHSIVASTKVGQVVSYRTNGDGSVAQRNFTKDYVTLADGTKIEKSQLYYTVQGTRGTAGTNGVQLDQDAVVPQVFNNDGTSDAERYTNGTYRFYLDQHGDYVGAEPVYGEEFIYGTYADYSQEISSSAFKYFMTGVTLEGEIVTREFSSLNSNMVNTSNLSDVDTYYHNHSSATTGNIANNKTSAAGVGVAGARDKYNGFMLTSAGALYDSGNMSPDNRGIHKLMGASVTYMPIVQSDVTKGAVTVGNDSNGDPLYITGDTTILVVSGIGTDSAKVEKYEGLADFVDGCTQVQIGVTGTAADVDSYYVLDDSYYGATDQRWSNAIGTLILNSSNVLRAGASGYLFSAGAVPKLVDQSNANYKLYTFYNGDTAIDYWIDTAVATGAVVPARTTFYTGVTRVGVNSTGDPLYIMNVAPNDKYTSGGQGSTAIVNGKQGNAVDSSGSGLTYVARARNAQTALIGAGMGGALYNVANAKVVNLIPGKLPNLNSLEDLNEISSSLHNDGGARFIYVYISVTAPGGSVVDTIYVTGIGT